MGRKERRAKERQERKESIRMTPRTASTRLRVSGTNWWKKQR